MYDETLQQHKHTLIY